MGIFNRGIRPLAPPPKIPQLYTYQIVCDGDKEYSVDAHNAEIVYNLRSVVLRDCERRVVAYYTNIVSLSSDGPISELR